MILAGTPATTQRDGTDLTTTALAPMTQWLPISMGPIIFAPAPMYTSSPTHGTLSE